MIHVFSERGLTRWDPKRSGGAPRRIDEQNRVGAVQGRRAAATRPGGFLSELVKTVLERGLRAELTEHLGYGRLGRPQRWRSCRTLAPAPAVRHRLTVVVTVAVCAVVAGYAQSRRTTRTTGRRHQPGLLATNGVGPDVAGPLLVSAGQNHDRLASEAAFAMLCGAAPIPASSGKTNPAPAQPRWRQAGQRRALPRRTCPAAMGPTHP